VEKTALSRSGAWLRYVLLKYARLSSVLLVCAVLLCVSCGRPGTVTPEQTEPRTETGLARHIEELAAEKYEGRRSGTAGEARAAFYLARAMREAGLEPRGDGGTFFQTFPIAAYEPALYGSRMTLQQKSSDKGLFSENILGFLPGEEEGVIIVSAHYDHLGIIDGRLYPGANDNASGVGAVLDLAARLRQGRPRCGILFALWGAEEAGLVGSGYCCSQPPVPPDQLRCVINLDSLGNLSSDQKLLGWKNGENEESRLIWQTLAAGGWQIDWQDSGRHSSDHASFGVINVSAFTLLSPNWLQENHTPGDMAADVRTGPLADLVQALVRALSVT
jgi:aminopeptidase YwaD